MLNLPKIFRNLLITCMIGLVPMHSYALIPQSDKNTLASLGNRAFTQNSADLQRVTSSLVSDGAKSYVTWRYLTNPVTSPSLNEIISFLARNPDWPRMDIVRGKLEKRLIESGDSGTVFRYFEANPPTLYSSKKYFASALLETDPNRGKQFIRDVWRTDLLTPSDQHDFLRNFTSYLSSDDHYQRMQFLMGRQYITQAQSMSNLLSGSTNQEMNIRTALIRLKSNALSLYSNAPASIKNKQAVLRDLVHYYSKKDKDDTASDIMKRVGVPPQSEADFWYPYRNILSRVAYKNGQVSLAYKIASEGGEMSAGNFVELNWYAGWLALRKLNRPSDALRHFEAILARSKMPVSRSRGHYWIARSYAAMGNSQMAQQYYNKAATYFYTYYGQLAMAELGRRNFQIPPSLAVDNNIRQIYRNNNLVQAIYAANHMDNKSDAKSMIMHIASRKSMSPQIYYMLAKTSRDINMPQLGVKIAKAANANKVFLFNSGYPMSTVFNPYRGNEHEALYRALTRQESEYDQYARSPVGALGLMQVMPATAQLVCRKLGKSYSLSAMTNNPAYNVSLGTKFLTDLVYGFDGSYIKAMAGYNAGPGRVRQWMNSYGNLSEDRHQIIDWVETIPFSETRNYVQRNLENIQIYRARMSGTRTMNVDIVKDMMRGV